MKKKIVMMLAIVLIVSGSAWAQVDPPKFDVPDPWLSLWAAPTTSVEKRYSAGTFDSDVDNYIDPTAFDGEIGTFMFAGGFPSLVTDTFTTNTLTGFPNEGVTDYDTVSLGFAKTLGADKYLGIYYGGSLVNAHGSNIAKDPNNDDDMKSATREAVWRNKLGVLFGIGKMGITFDLIMDNTTDSEYTSTDGKKLTSNIGNAPTIALGWGTNINDKLTPWVKLGFKFPDSEFITNDNPKDLKKATYSYDARLGMDAGAWIGLNDTSSMLFNLIIGGQLPASYKGDETVIGGLTGFSNTEAQPYTSGGAFGMELYAKFTKAIALGDVTLKLKPNLDLLVISQSNDATIKDAKKMPSNDWFQLKTGLDIGAEYVFDKIALYSGLGLTIFDWQVYGHNGGEKEMKVGDNLEAQWGFTGLAWEPTRFGNGGSLGFGLTFTPIEGLVFGTGINIGAIFNPVLMELTTRSSSTTSGWDVWNNAALSITVSYKFASKPKEPKAPKAEVEEAPASTLAE